MAFKTLIILISLFANMSVSAQQNIYTFSESSSLEDWQVINDGVMGGLSSSRISLNEEGYGRFSGHVSLANNGGFASVRLLTKTELDNNSQYIVLHVKGDGKTYQFRLKGDKNQSQSYVQEFETNGEWQTIKLELSKFSPQFRGRTLDIPNFNFSKIEEVRFLIANKKEEDFNLLIKSIDVQ